MNPTGRRARTLVFAGLLMLFIAWSVLAQETPPPDDTPSPTATPLPPTTDPTLLTLPPAFTETPSPTETPLPPTTVTETPLPTETSLPPTTDPTLLTPPPTVTETPQLTATATETLTLTETPTLEGTPTPTPTETITLTVTPTASATWPVPPVPPRPPLDPVPQRPVGRSLLTGDYNDPRTFVGAAYAVVAPSDSNALQAIIDNAESTGACAGYDIYLLEGDYVFEATLYLSNGCTVSIFGRNEDGLELTFIQPDGSLEDTLIQVSDVSVLALHNLTLRDAYAVAYGANTVGGAIRIYEGATLEVYDSVFENNMTSGFGGAIYNRAGQAFVYRTDFLANVGYVGSAYYSFGYSEEAQPYAQMECLRFEDNIVTQFTGAMAAYSFGYYSNIHDSSFINNTVQTEDIWDDSVVHIQSYAYKYSEPIDPLFDAQSNWWNRSTGPTGWEVAHDLINVINPKVDVSNWLSSAPNCPKQDPVPLPDEICLPGGSGLSTFDEECPLTLEDFGIELDGTWTTTEQEEILMAAIETGNALFAHGAGSSAVEAFREVLQGMNGGQWRQIQFSRISAGGVYCTTAKNPSAGFSADIQCDSALVMNQHTAVHEFGHVLVGRTTLGGASLYLNMIENPGGGSAPLQDLAPTPHFVMGSRTYPIAIGPTPDWERSDVVVDNGWGSAGLWDQSSYFVYDFPPPPPPTPTPFPLRVPKIGPCGPGAPSLPVINANPFDFQQNPCTFPNWEASDPVVGPVTEIEEAAADMFLNWVYWKNYGNAFLDNFWRFDRSNGNCYATGCSDPDGSGQARAEWMEQTMTTLFNTFNW